jgi:hypothetical protein
MIVTRLLRVIILSVAAAELALLVLFGLASVSGDSLNIARSLFLLLAAPFLLVTVPALLMLWRGRLAISACLMALSALASVYL